MPIVAVATAVFQWKAKLGKIGTHENFIDLGTKSLNGYKCAKFGKMILNDMHGSYDDRSIKRRKLS